MTRARQQLVSLSDTPWYHLVNRCVRRAYLCGVDSISGNSYEHRREWIEQTMLKLASVFAVDVAAFAVMSNHYHLVVRVDKARADRWSDEEVLSRWTQLFSGPLLLQRYLAEPDEAEPYVLEQVEALAQTYRERLYDLSWFMRVLNETIARMANKEDGAKGRFWEGRFKSQALLDEQAILSVMAYVDLNPVRARMAEGLEDSQHTSIQRRIQHHQGRLPQPTPLSESPFYEHLTESTQSFFAHMDALPMAPLMPFTPGDHHSLRAAGIAFAFEDYLEFVDYLGRAVHPNKPGFISGEVPRLMTQLNMSEQLVEAVCEGRLLKGFGHSIGKAVEPGAPKEHRRAPKGQGLARQMFA